MFAGTHRQPTAQTPVLPVIAKPRRPLQAETMGFTRRWPGHVVCPDTAPDQVERYSDIRPALEPYGLVVRVWPKAGPEPDFLRSPVDIEK